MMKFRRTFRLALLLASGVALAGCGSDTSNNVSFRMIQASPDLPLVNLLVDGVILRSGIDYKGGTGFLTVTPQAYEFGVEAILVGQDGVVTNVPVLLPPVEKSLAVGKEYTVIAIGRATTQSVQPLVIENVTEEVPPGNARLQFVHAVPDVPPVDIYVTAVPALPASLPDLSQKDLIAQVTYGKQPGPRKLVPPGTYVIRVTLEDSKDAVFESGEIALSNGNDFLVVAVENTAAGPSPISLAVNSGFRAFYNPVGTFDIFDKDTVSELRVVQVSPDAPALDVVGDPDTAASPERTFATALTYLDSTGYVPTIPDIYAIRGVKTSDPDASTALFAITSNLVIGQRITLFPTGLLASIKPVVLPGDIRPVFAEGKLRILNASPSSGTVDVYVLATDQHIDIADVAATVPNLLFLTLVNGVPQGAIPYLPFFPRNYTVTFTVAGSKTVLATKQVAATGGTVQSAILVDEIRVNSSSDGKPPAVLLVDDRSSSVTTVASGP